MGSQYLEGIRKTIYEGTVLSVKCVFSSRVFTYNNLHDYD